MKNKKAFTLMEMLVVIILIGIVLTIVIPSVIKIMGANDSKMYNTHIELLEKQTELYTVKYNGKFESEKSASCYKLTYEEIILEGFEEETIQCTGNIIINNNTNKNYTYNYYLNCIDEEGKELSNNLKETPTNCISISANENRPSAPTITGGSTEWTNKNKTITISKRGVASDGVKHYEYYLSTTGQTPSTSVKATGTTDGSLEVSKEGTSYVFYRTIANNGSKSKWSNSQTTKIDKQTPGIPEVSGEGNLLEIERELTVNAESTISGIKNYEYYISETNEEIEKSQKATGAFTGDKIKVNKTGTYIYFRTVNNAGTKSDWTEAKNLYVNTAILNNIIVKTSEREYEIEPLFTRENLEYELIVPNTVKEVEVLAEAVSSEAKVNGTGKVNLKIGKAEEKIEVIGTDTKRTYTVNITREQDPISTLASLKLTGCSLSPEFDGNITGYTCTVENEVTSMKVEAKATSDTAKITGLGEKSLSVGKNEIKVTVTSESGNKKVYTVEVTRKASSDATLKSLEVVGYELNQEFSSNQTKYVLNVLYNVENLEVKAEVNNIEASYIISGNENLKVGTNIIDITVTAGDGTIKVYTVTVSRALDTDTYLKSLSLSDCVLSPKFDKDTASYSCTVEYEVEETTVEAEASSEVAIISGLGPHILEVGVNEIEVTVIAQNSAEKTYTVEVTRKPDEDATLKELVVAGYSITPNFSSSVYEYSVTTEASSIEIIALANSLVATSVTGTGAKEISWGVQEFDIIVTAQSGKVIGYKITVTNTKPTEPVIAGGSNNWVSTPTTISLETIGNAVSGVSHYEYYKSTSSTAPINATLSNGVVNNGTEATGTTENDLTVSEEGTTYIWYRTVSNNGLRSDWSNVQTVKLDLTNPTIIVNVSGDSAIFTFEDNMGVVGYGVNESTTIQPNYTEIDLIKSITVTWKATNGGIYVVWVKDVSEKTTYTTFIIDDKEFCEYEVGQSWDFAYTGSIEEFEVPCNGIYQLEVYGGKGGGKGGSSIGYSSFYSGDNLFIGVGGKGSTSGAFNGGGKGWTYSYPNWTSTADAGGGGATHIATMTGTLVEIGEENLDKILIVAGGGGGGFYDNDGSCSGGTGGGESGGKGYTKNDDGNIDSYGTPGTQTSGNAFGKGGSASSSHYGGGGGGGLYGGKYTAYGSGSGGSGYIGGVPEFTANGITYTPSTTNGTNNAAGKAKITLVSFDTADDIVDITKVLVNDIEVPVGTNENYDYYKQVKTSVTLATIKVETFNPNSQVVITDHDGIESLQEGNNLYTITVTSSNGKVSKEYTLNIKRDPSTFLVNFDVNGGAGDATSKMITYGEPYGELPTPTRENYIFLGWYTDSNAGTQVLEDTIVSFEEEHTLYARWKSIYIKLIEYDYTYGTNGKTYIASPYTKNGFYNMGAYWRNNTGSTVTMNYKVSVSLWAEDYSTDSYIRLMSPEQWSEDWAISGSIPVTCHLNQTVTGSFKVPAGYYISTFTNNGSTAKYWLWTD